MILRSAVWLIWAFGELIRTGVIEFIDHFS